MCKSRTTLFRAWTGILFVLVLSGVDSCMVSETEGTKADQAQIEVIRDFVRTLRRKAAPTIADFIRLFGLENEAELSRQLHENFPGIDLGGEWYRDPQAKEFAARLFNEPAQHESAFLKCVKRSKAGIIAKTNVTSLVHLSSDAEFHRYKGTAGEDEVVFEFSGGGRTLENVYPYEGISIYDVCP